jgi:hypothetical protein
MILLVYYTVMVMLGTAAAALLGLWLDSISEIVSLSVFFTLFFGLLWGAWVIAVRLTEPKMAAEASVTTQSNQPAG